MIELETVREYEQRIQTGLAAERLLENRDYKDLFEKALFTTEVASLVSSLNKHPADSAETREILNQLRSISFIQHYLSGLVSAGKDAKVSLNEFRELTSTEELS